MKSKTKQGLLRFPMKLLYSGNYYYIDRVAALERAVKRKPRRLQIEMLGDGEIDVDWALVIRDVLIQRSAETRLITQARSTLKNGSVLVWLLGDQRIIREDARVFFRRANYSEPVATSEKVWDGELMEYVDSFSEADPEEANQARVLQFINEYLPVQELVGRIVDVPTLRQFGLIENEKFDALLTSAFSPAVEADAATKQEQCPKAVCDKPQAKPSNQIQS